MLRRKFFCALFGLLISIYLTCRSKYIINQTLYIFIYKYDSKTTPKTSLYPRLRINRLLTIPYWVSCKPAPLYYMITVQYWSLNYFVSREMFLAEAITYVIFFNKTTCKFIYQMVIYSKFMSKIQNIHESPAQFHNGDKPWQIPTDLTLKAKDYRHKRNNDHGNPWSKMEVKCYFVIDRAFPRELLIRELRWSGGILENRNNARLLVQCVFLPV